MAGPTGRGAGIGGGSLRFGRARVKLGGDMGRVIRRLAVLAAWACGAVLLGVVALALLFRVVDPPLTPLMVLRAVEAARRGEWVLPSHRSVPLDAVSPAVVRALVVAEDARFYEHGGIDGEALRRAFDYNLRRRDGRLHGGSTITMQCARSVFLWPGRTYLRKGLELALAPLLEAAWGKRRILEVYLNVVEWGD